MSSALIAFFFAAGISGWVYSKVSRRTGDASTQNTLILTGFAGLLSFLIAFSILQSIS